MRYYLGTGTDNTIESHIIMNIPEIALIGVVALILTLLLTPLSIRLAIAVGAVDVPDGRKIHRDNTPRLGGLALAIAFGTSCYFFLSPDSIINAALIGLVIIILTGLADDIWHIRPALKFTGEIAASLAFVIYGGTELKEFGDLIGIGTIGTGIFAVPITVFCMVGVMNAINLCDGLDGLAGGLSAIACLFLAYFSFMSGQWLNLMLSVSLCGCLIGFLYFNTYPARVFMGDTGSLVVGYILSSICVLSQKLDADTPISPISMALILALPIADTLWVLSNRVLSGKSPFLPDKTHLHHKLLSLNLSCFSVVSTLYVCMFIFGFMAVFMQPTPEWIQFVSGTGFVVFLYATIAILQQKRFGFLD